MQNRTAIATLLLLTIVYLIAIFVADSRQHVFERFSTLATILPSVIILTLTSYALRYARWRWLLARRGYFIPASAGFLAYVAGFAYTATPGKVGELLRIRYFGRFGVSADRVLACFIFERLADLVVLLIFAIMLARTTPFIGTCFAFVLLAVAAVATLAASGRAWAFLLTLLRRAKWQRPARLVAALASGFRFTISFFNGTELVGALGLGALAWLVQMLGFYAILQYLDANLSIVEALAVPSAAMLIGAASMLPGGIGTTETAMVVLLTRLGVSGDAAISAAICMRLGTIWFAVLLGLVVVYCLERELTSLPRKIARGSLDVSQRDPA